MVFCLAAAACAGQAAALPLSVTERAAVFASCAGAALADLEHAWVTGGAGIAEAEARRAAFLDLMQAVAPDAAAAGLSEQAMLARAVQARADQRALLSAATFDLRPERQAPAAKAAATRRADCAALLLGA